MAAALWEDLRPIAGLVAATFGAVILMAGIDMRWNGDEEEGGAMQTGTATRTRFHVRWMIRIDMDDVYAIDAASFDRPWTEDEFLRTLRGRNCIGMVAEDGDRVVGFMIYELHRDRIEILRLAVAPDFRRRGVGRRLVEKLAGKLSVQKRNRIGIDVRESNLAGHLALRAMGLKATRVIWDHFDDGDDAYRFLLRIEDLIEGPAST